jgi:hypothetical protein
MQVIPNSEIGRMEGEQATLDGILDDTAAVGLQNSMISDYIWNCWEKAKRFKENGAEARILANMRQIDGQYDPGKLADIKKIGGSEVFMMITDAKQKNASYWVQDILFQPGQRSWGIEPSPVPELPPEVKEQIVTAIFQSLMEGLSQAAELTGQMPNEQYIQGEIASAMPEIEKAVKEEILRTARERAKDTEQSVDDKLTEGGYYSALRKMIPNCIAHTGFLKGPINKKRRIMKVVTDGEGRLTKQVTEEIYPTWESRHPLYIYPAPGSVDVNDGYLIDRVKLTPLALQDLLGVDGYDSEEIMAVLDEAESGKLFEWLPVDQDIADINEENSMISYDSDKIDCLEFWGTVRGSYLADWGLAVENESFFYNIKAYLIGSHVIGIQFNDDPMGRKPFYKDSFENKDGSFWGKGLPEVIADCQGVCNAVSRAIVNNAAMASGPQVERNIDRIPPHAREDTALIPWKVWDTTSDMMSNGKAIEFFQPPMVVEKLLQVYNAYSKIADEHSGVPGFAHGDTQVGGAGNALANYEEILTPCGPVAMGDVSVGDEVVNTYGGVSKITGVYPQGESDIFRMYFNNGEHVDCDMNHRWSVEAFDHYDRKVRTMTTAELLERGLFQKTKKTDKYPDGYRPKWALPLIDGVEFAPRDVKIDPYTLGCLIGDGTYGSRSCKLISMDQEIFDRIPYPLGKKQFRPENKSWVQSIGTITGDFRSYGLNCKSIHRFIPEDYLYNTREVRLELLRGLMDTDGTAYKTGSVRYYTSSKRLARDFKDLVNSLGANVQQIERRENGSFVIKGKKYVSKTSYSVVFNLPGEKIFHLERKQSKVITSAKPPHTFIVGVKYIGKFEATCISVDSSNELFVCKNLIVTHNTASGLNMLMSSAARGIRGLVSSLDENVIKPAVERQYVYIVDTEPNYGFICDYNIVTSGSAAALVKEQMAARRIEFMNATANPLDAQILGIEGRKYLLEETARSIQLDLSRVFPPAQTAPPQPAGPGDQSEKPQALDAAGSPVVGQDSRAFNQPAQ